MLNWLSFDNSQRLWAWQQTRQSWVNGEVHSILSCAIPTCPWGGNGRLKPIPSDIELNCLIRHAVWNSFLSIMAKNTCPCKAIHTTWSESVNIKIQLGIFTDCISGRAISTCVFVNVHELFYFLWMLFILGQDCFPVVSCRIVRIVFWSFLLPARK